MGTQQLLLLVLVAIIVGVAIALAVTYFRSSQQETEINEVINELNNISISAQGWYMKPLQLSGGNKSFTGFTLAVISQPDSTDIANYKVVTANGDLLTLEATGYTNFTIDVNVTPNSIGSFNVVRW